MADALEKDPRVYFAAERTYLAWIRTGLALMGVGFAVSRFGLFLREFTTRQGQGSMKPTAHSVVAGVALVLLGVIVDVAATIHHIRITRQLVSGRWIPGQISKNAVVLAVLLAAGGAAMAVYLFLFR